jgi:hypothetical protein
MAAGAPCGQWEWRFVLTDSLPPCENRQQLGERHWSAVGRHVEITQIAVLADRFVGAVTIRIELEDRPRRLDQESSSGWILDSHQGQKTGQPVLGSILDRQA